MIRFSMVCLSLFVGSCVGMMLPQILPLDAFAQTNNAEKGLLARVRDLEEQVEPIGTIEVFSGSCPPTGSSWSANRLRYWLPCDGRPLTRSDFSDLFRVIEYKYGGDGGSTFKLPDLTNKFPMGAGANLSLATSGGRSSAFLSVQNLPPHTHSGRTGSGNAMGYRQVEGAGPGGGSNHTVGHRGGGASADKNDANYLGGDHTHNFTTDGGKDCNGAAFDITPPYLALQFIIKVR